MCHVALYRPGGGLSSPKRAWEHGTGLERLAPNTSNRHDGAGLLLSRRRPAARGAAVARFAFLDEPKDTEPGLTYRHYLGQWKRLPRFTDLEPAGRGVTQAILLGLTEKGGDFARVFRGYLNIDEAGEYVFYVASDDGSDLYLDGERIVNNDGIHASREKSGTVRLDRGLHLVRVEYFDAGGGKELIVQWQGPGFDKQPLAGDMLRH